MVMWYYMSLFTDGTDLSLKFSTLNTNYFDQVIVVPN